MRVLTRFQSAYDKYLFEGIIKPEDYFGINNSTPNLSSTNTSNTSFTGTNIGGTGGVWSGTVLNNKIVDSHVEEAIVSLYVLNTLDHNTKIEPDNPDNILTRFFSSMKTTNEDSGDQSSKTLISKNMLLISIQNTKVLNDVVAYFTSLEKSIRPKEPVTVYTISSLNLFSKILDIPKSPEPSVLKSPEPSEPSEPSVLKSPEPSDSKISETSFLKTLIDSYGKHTYIDLSLALTAIELFKRRKLFNIYRTIEEGFEPSKPSVLNGIGINLLNHHDKKIKISTTNSEFILYVPSFKITECMLKNIYDFLEPINENNKVEDTSLNEKYAKRLVPMLPKFNYRLYDKLETFYIKSVSKDLNVKKLYNVLIIKNLDISYKILLYISIFKWNLIFFKSDTSSDEKYTEDVSTEKISECYEQLSNIYNDPRIAGNKVYNDLKQSSFAGNKVYNDLKQSSFAGKIKPSKDDVLHMSKAELKKLNPDYSLLRTPQEVESFNAQIKTIFPDKVNTPHILIDNYNDIKNYLKKLEISLSVDNISVNVIEL